MAARVQMTEQLTQTCNRAARAASILDRGIPEIVRRDLVRALRDSGFTNVSQGGNVGQIIVNFTTPSGFACHITYHNGGVVAEGPAGAFHIQVHPFGNQYKGGYPRRYLRLIATIVDNEEPESSHLNFRIVEYNPRDDNVYGGDKRINPVQLSNELDTVITLMNQFPLPVHSPNAAFAINAVSIATSEASRNRRNARAEHNLNEEALLVDALGLQQDFIDSWKSIIISNVEDERVIEPDVIDPLIFARVKNDYRLAGAPPENFETEFHTYAHNLILYWAQDDRTQRELLNKWIHRRRASGGSLNKIIRKARKTRKGRRNTRRAYSG